MTKQMLTAKEVMAKYKISRQTLQRAVQSGQLPKRTFAGGKKLYFKEEEIIKLFSNF